MFGLVGLTIPVPRRCISAVKGGREISIISMPLFFITPPSQVKRGDRVGIQLLVEDED